MMVRRACGVVMILTTGCAGAIDPVRDSVSARSPAPAPLRQNIIPLADHHQHLLGPHALPPAPKLLPEVDVPEEIRALLQERARLNAQAKTAGDLAPVFTDDAQATTWKRPSMWVRGESDLLEVMNQVAPLVFVYSANAWDLGDSVGFVAGTVDIAVNEEGPFQKALDFLLALKKGPDGWRIAAEHTTIRTAPMYARPIRAEKLIDDLEEAGIARAIVLSNAYWLGGRFDDPAAEMTAEYEAVRAENDWVAAQIALYPDRLIMACSVHPLKRYALEELDRCTSIPGVKAFKLHVADADLDFHDASHVRALKEYFARANRHRLPIVVHLAPRMNYGPVEVEIFLSEILTESPDIMVQIAHLAGDGPGITSPDALQAFAEARASGDPRTKNLYFDFAGLVTANTSAEGAELMVRRMRQIGLDRILYASDGAPPNEPTGEHWRQTRRKLPLTDDELAIIATNVAPYFE